MFMRMLLPPEVRERYDVSGMQAAIHAAAPCPTAEVKRAMIDWWGPVVNEVLRGDRSSRRVCLIGSDALTRPGSVGKAGLGIVHICDENGDEVPSVEGDRLRDAVPFVYQRPGEDPQEPAPPHTRHGRRQISVMSTRTASSTSPTAPLSRSSSSVGGCGRRESENILINHPAVYDVAVLGVPTKLGEQVIGVRPTRQEPNPPTSWPRN